MDSKGLKMAVSESDKMEASVLGFRLSEKAEHLPIKKRRFLFRESSPPPNTESSEGTESVAACLPTSSQEVANCPPDASLTVAGLCQTGSVDGKLDGEKPVMGSKKASEDEDICGTSLVDQTACSNGLGGDTRCESSEIVLHDMKKLETPDTVKLENMSAKETESDKSTAPSKDVASSKMDCSSDKAAVDESTLDDSCPHVPMEIECSKMNQVTSSTQNLAALDDRLNWDLNTVMDAWEEPLGCDHNIKAADVVVSNIAYTEGKNSHSEGCEQGRECGSTTENIEKENLPVATKSLIPKVEETETEVCNPGIKLLSPVIYSASHAAVNKIKALHNQPIDRSTDFGPVSVPSTLALEYPVSVPSTLALEYPVCDISAKNVNVNKHKGTDDLSSPMAARTGFSLDYTVLPSFDPSLNMGPSKQIVVSSKIVGSGNNIDHAVHTAQTSEHEKLSLSLVAVGSLENQVPESGITFDEDDKTKVKKLITSNEISIENFMGKVIESSPSSVSSKIAGPSNSIDHGITNVQTTENEKLSLSLVTSSSPESVAHPIGSTYDEDDKSKVKRIITSNGISTGNLTGKWVEISQSVVSSKFAGSGDSANHVISTVPTTTTTTTTTTTENEKLNLSLVTSASPQNGAHQSGSTFDEDDKAKVKRIIASNGTNVETLTSKKSESSQDNHKQDCKDVNQTTIDSQSSLIAEGEDHPVAFSSKHDVVHSDVEVPIKAGTSSVSETIFHIPHEPHTEFPSDLKSYNKEACRYENFPSDIQAGSEVDNVGELSFGYDSQFEDGEFRDSSIQTWEGYKGEERETELGVDKKAAFGPHENGSISAPESSSKLRSTDVGSQKGDEISSIPLPEKLESSEHVSGCEPNETGNGTTEVSMKDAIESDQWKMNVSGSDLLPENHSSSITNMKDLSSIKFSSRIERFGPENGDHEVKAEDSRFCRRELISRIGDPSTRDAFLDRRRFRMQGCSSSNVDDSASRSVRDLVVPRSPARRGKYSPHILSSGRGGGTWNRSPPFPGPSFRRALHDDASVDNLTNEVSIDPSVTRQSFRSRLVPNREEDEFRARLGLRPSGDSCHNRFVNVGGGRSLRYGSRHNGGGPRGRYHGPANDDYDEPSMEHSRSFPARRRCFSGSTSPPVLRTRSPISDGFRRRSRSPNFRPDTRIRRPRSPDYRHGFETNLEPRNNNSPPSSRWVNLKARPAIFDRRSPPPIGERLSYYDSSRKTKQNENFRSGPPTRLSELHGTGRGGPRYLGNDDDLPDNGYRRGGFVKRYDMGRPIKYVEYDEEDGYGPVYESRDKEGLDFHGRGNPKPYNNGTTDSRFRDLPRRAREDRENW